MVAWTPMSRQKNMTQVLEEIDTLLEYHLQQTMEEAKTLQWQNQKAILKAQEEQRKAKLKKIMRWSLASLTIITLIGLGIFYQDILSLFDS